MENCYKKVSGTKHSFEKNGRWVMVTPLGKKKGYIASTIKEGNISIIGKSTSRSKAYSMAKKYMGKVC